MPLRDIENRPGVVYDPTKKNRLFAEDLQGLDTRITDLEETGGGGFGNPFHIIENMTTRPSSDYFLYDILDIDESVCFEIGLDGLVLFLSEEYTYFN